MSTTTLTIATRKSPLARWQAQYVQQQLLAHYPHLTINIIGQTTAGDKTQDKPLADIGGKDLFVKELQQMLLNNEADIAVHSIKDMSVKDAPGLSIAAFCPREDPRDVFISNTYQTLQDCPSGAVIGTSSPRRQSQLKALYPTVKATPIRGNVGTRLNKLDAGQFDGIILAAAGIKRLNLDKRIREYLDLQTFIPAIGQGVIGVECRSNDAATHTLLQALDNYDARIRMTTERAINQRLGGDCFTPIAAHAVLHGNDIHCIAMVGSLDGGKILRSEIRGKSDAAEQLGLNIADDLLVQGADVLLRGSQ